MRNTRGLIGLLLILLTGCAPVVDPCIGQEERASCRLRLAQEAARFEAEQATRVADEARVATARVQAANDGATATAELRTATSAVATATADSRRATATVAREQTATADARTATSEAKTATAESRQQTATATVALVTATAVKRQQDYEDQQRAIGYLASLIGEILLGIFKLALIVVAGVLVLRYLSAILRAIGETVRTHTNKHVDANGNTIWIIDGRVTDPRLLLKTTTKMDGSENAADELAILIKGRDQKARVYELLAKSGVMPSGGGGEEGWTETGRSIVPSSAPAPEGAGDDRPVLPPPAPAFHELLSQWAPERSRMLLAWGMDGPIYGGIDSLLSVGIVGRQNMGKTTLLRFITAQCLMVGARVVIWDLHGDIVKEIPGVAACTTVDAINRSAQLVVQELDRRIRGRLHDEPPMVVVGDEFNAIADRCEEAVPTCTRIVFEGRKFGMFCMVSTKVFSARMFGGAGVRDAFSSHFAFHTTPHMARMLGFESEDADVVRYLKPGQALFDGPVDAQVVSVPETTVDDIKRIFPPSSSPSAPSGRGAGRGVGRGPEAGTEGDQEVDPAKVDLVRRLLAQRTPASQIIREVWGVTGGSGYQRAALELSTIISSLVQQAAGESG